MIHSGKYENTTNLLNAKYSDPCPLSRNKQNQTNREDAKFAKENGFFFYLRVLCVFAVSCFLHNNQDEVDSISILSFMFLP